MKKIIFTGVLGEKFGREFMLDVRSPAEAMVALTRQISGLERFVKANNFNVWADDQNLTTDTVGMIYEAETFKFGLDIDGAGGGGGLWGVIAGVAMIAVGFWNPLGWGVGATLLMGAGAGLAMSGLGMMLMPQASVGTIDQEGNRSSYSFGEAVTTTAQGNPIPVSYGECVGGGFVMSVNIKTRNILY